MNDARSRDSAVRYAIYWAPPSVTPLAEIGEAWLGRNAETGRRSVERIMPDGFSAAELEAITAEPSAPSHRAGSSTA